MMASTAWSWAAMRAARLCREALRSSVLSYVLGRSKSTIKSVCLSRRLEACGVNRCLRFSIGQHGVGGCHWRRALKIGFVRRSTHPEL